MLTLHVPGNERRTPAVSTEQTEELPSAMVLFLPSSALIGSSVHYAWPHPSALLEKLYVSRVTS